MSQRKWRLIFAGVSAALCAGFMSLWVASGVWSFTYTRPITGGYRQIAAARGQIGLKIIRHYVVDDWDGLESLDPVPPTWSRSSPPVPFTPIHQTWKFGAFHRHNQHNGVGYVAIFDYRLILMPIWPLILFTSLPPLWWLIRRPKRQTGRGFAVRPLTART